MLVLYQTRAGAIPQNLSVRKTGSLLNKRGGSMKSDFFANYRLVFLCACLLAASLIAGCSKHKEDSSASQTPSTPVASTPAPDSGSAPANDPSAQASSAPVLDSSQMSGDPKVAMTEADSAVRQKEYEKAARLMLAIQQAQLNQQQAEAAYQQMVAFQRNLAAAVANGDPNAKAAADVLRASRHH
jgi:hypothetical protein